MRLRQTNEEVMKLEAGIDVGFGPFKSRVYGGPFKKYRHGQRRLVGVKMAAEIKAEHDISIPTVDFSVPSITDMQNGLIEAVEAISQGNDLYAGCMGGIGRTGLFMGCLIKSLQDADQYPLDVNPVMEVREHYYSHAIETVEQMNYVATFPSAPVVARIHELLKPLTDFVEVIEYIEVPVEVPVPMTIGQTFKAMGQKFIDKFR